MKFEVQIDVREIRYDTGLVHCNLYTGKRCIKMIMQLHDYEALVEDGFFVRDGKHRDSANVLNTTPVFEMKGVAE